MAEPSGLLDMMGLLPEVDIELPSDPVADLAGRLADEFGAKVSFVETNLFAVDGPMRNVVLDAIAVGGDFPVVLVEDAAVCAGVIEQAAVVEAVDRHLQE